MSVFCYSIVSCYFQKVQKRSKKKNPYGLIQIFWRDTIALYGEQIEFSLIYTYKHSSANISRSSTEHSWYMRTNLIGSCWSSNVLCNIRMNLISSCWSSNVLRNTRMNLSGSSHTTSKHALASIYATDVWVDQCLYMNKSLHSICSPYKAIKSLQENLD